MSNVADKKTHRFHIRSQAKSKLVGLNIVIVTSLVGGVFILTTVVLLGVFFCYRLRYRKTHINPPCSTSNNTTLRPTSDGSHNYQMSSLDVVHKNMPDVEPVPLSPRSSILAIVPPKPPSEAEIFSRLQAQRVAEKHKRLNIGLASDGLVNVPAHVSRSKYNMNSRRTTKVHQLAYSPQLRSDTRRKGGAIERRNVQSGNFSMGNRQKSFGKLRSFKGTTNKEYRALKRCSILRAINRLSRTDYSATNVEQLFQAASSSSYRISEPDGYSKSRVQSDYEFVTDEDLFLWKPLPVVPPDDEIGYI